MTKLLDDLDADPILIPHEGRLKWLFPSGRIVHDVRGGDEPDPDPDKKFSQAEVDRIVEDRLKRERAKAPDKPADYDQLKADSAELAKVKADQEKAAADKLTEKEQTDKRIADLEKKITESDERAAKANADALLEKRRSAVVAAASSAKAANPQQVFALLPPDAVIIGDDGQVTGAEEAVKKFLTDNPHFVGKTGPKPDPGQGKGDAKSFGESGRAEAAKRFGPPAGAQQQQQK